MIFLIIWLAGIIPVGVIMRWYDLRHERPTDDDEELAMTMILWPLALFFLIIAVIPTGLSKLTSVIAQKIVQPKTRIDTNYTNEDMEEVEDFLQKENKNLKL